MLVSVSSNAASVVPGKSHFRGDQKVLSRIFWSRSGICCKNQSIEFEGSISRDCSQNWRDRLTRGAGVFIGTVSLCLVSCLAAFPNLANADVEAATDPAASLPELIKKEVLESRKETPKRRIKVPARVLRAKFQERKLKAVLRKIEEEPENVVAYKALLQLRMENGEVNEAIKVLEKLIEMQPGNLELRYMRARSYQLVGNVIKARDEFQKLLEIEPLSAKALQGLALAMGKDGEDDFVILEMIKRAIQNANDQNQTLAARNFRMLLGQMLTMQGKVNEALEQYEGLIKEDPGDFRPYLCKGLLYDSLGKKEEAWKYYSEYRNLCPKSFPNRKYLDELLIKGNLSNRLREEEKEGQHRIQMQQPRPLFSREDSLLSEEEIQD